MVISPSKSRLKINFFSFYNGGPMKEERVIAVIDLKAFYSYVECVERGLDPWSTPLVVADKERGKNTIVLSVSPFLKSKGVPSRCRISELPKKYNYIYAVPRMEKYLEKSSEVMSIILDYIAEEDMHIYSIDETFIDLTSYLSYYKKTPTELVKYIKDKIKEKTHLETTAGIGDNFFLAKVALDIYAKHEKDGIATITKKDVPSKVWNITELSDVWGIGHQTEAKLHALGIYSMKDLANSNKDYLIKCFGIMGEQLYNHANGIDEADMHEVYIPKETSLSIGQVLFKDYTLEEAKLIIKEMNDDLSIRLRLERRLTNVVSLYIGYSKDLGGFSRQMKLPLPSDDTETLIEVCLELLRQYGEDKPIRRIGIAYGKLIPIPEYEQLSLFRDPIDQKNRRSLNYVLDEIKSMYGKDSVLRCSSLLSHSTVKERHNQIGGHKRNG